MQILKLTDKQALPDFVYILITNSGPAVDQIVLEKVYNNILGIPLWTTERDAEEFIKSKNLERLLEYKCVNYDELLLYLIKRGVLDEKKENLNSVTEYCYILK